MACQGIPDLERLVTGDAVRIASVQIGGKRGQIASKDGKKSSTLLTRKSALGGAGRMGEASDLAAMAM
jgi:hypothetical protein